MNPARRSRLIRRAAGVLTGLAAVPAPVTTGPAACASALRADPPGWLQRLHVPGRLPPVPPGWNKHPPLPGAAQVHAALAGIPDPDALAAVARTAAAAGRPIRSVVVTLPDNPTGQLPNPPTVRALCQVAAAHRLVIICDEIYRDLVRDPAATILSPAQVAPQHTVITTGLSKSLALGGSRIGVARMPAEPPGRRLRRALLGVGSEIWSASAAPIQHAAA